MLQLNLTCMITTYLNGFQVRAVVRTQAITKLSSPASSSPVTMVLPFRKFQRIIDHVFRLLLLYCITSVTKRLTGLWITLKDFQYSMTSTRKQQQQSCSIFFDKYQKSPQAFLFHVSRISIYFRQLFYLFPSRFHLEKIRIYLKYEINNTTVLLKIEKY